MADLPDFLIIGAMKCGTTTLQAQLARQQGVFCLLYTSDAADE